MGASNQGLRLLGWDEVLSADSPWAFAVVGQERALDDFALQAPAEVDARIIRGSNCRDGRGLFREWAAALQFPYYFGRNWDAFDECINDLEWLNARSVVVLVGEIEEVLADEPDRFQGTLIEILASAARTPGVSPGPSQSVGIEGPPLVRFIFHSEHADTAMSKFGEMAGELAWRAVGEVGED